MLRIGVLGTARITPWAIVEPARELLDVAVVAVAARSSVRAQAFAREHGIPEVDASYEALLARPDLDAVYVPLPVSAHREWSERALLAGKHVLCEKPMAMHAGEARDVVALARERGLVLAEAFHYRYHPLMARLLEIVASGELGAVEFVEAVFVSPVAREKRVYWDPRLGGGSTRHNGCYAIHCVRAVAGEEPEVVAAEAAWEDGVDVELRAELRFPSGIRSRVRSAIDTPREENRLLLTGSRGEARVENFVFPSRTPDLPTACQGGSIEVHAAAGNRREEIEGPSTYRCQLEAFAEAVRGHAPMATSGADIVGNATAIDSLLAAAAA